MVRGLKLVFIMMASLTSVCKAQLYINELSNGDFNTAQEYVELLVAGTTTCSDSRLDIRGWIIDDNNGWYKSGSTAGIAQGCLRFPYLLQWECVRFGSLIVIYNQNDRNLQSS